MTSVVRLLIAGGVSLLVGCGGASVTRYAVSGEVTFDGAPVPAGRIDFEPDPAKGNRGPAGTATIKAGRYATAPGQGIVGGPHIVRISGRDGVPLELESGDVDPAGKQLFAEYTEEVDFPLEATTHEFRVPASEPASEPPSDR